MSSGPMPPPASAARQPPPSAQSQHRPAPARQFGPDQVNYLTGQGFSMGLIRAISLSANSFPLRMWIIANTSTMQKHDGHKLQGRIENINMVGCSRWEELLQTAYYHIDAAGHLGLPARFTMVNNSGQGGGPKRFGVGEKGPASALQDIQLAKETIAGTTASGTARNITAYIASVRQEITSLAPKLQRERKAVTLVLALDGLPSDERGNESPAILQQFVQALRSLENLPVTVVVRLCTDDEGVVDFYNTIDEKLNLRFDVLNDYFAEALEVFLHNPWLNYTYPLHRFRELGFNFAATDELDERTLTFSELRELCSILFSLGEGNARIVLPDPATQWHFFMNALSNLLSKEKLQFNPITKKLEPWIDLNRLQSIFVPQSVPQHFPQGPYASQTLYQQQPQVHQQQQFQSTPQNNQQYRQQNQAQQGFRQPQYQQQPPQFPRQQQPMPSNQNVPPFHPSTAQQAAAQPQGPRQSTPSSNSAPQPQQQQQSAFASSANPPPRSQPSEGSVVDETSIKRDILTTWALQPPNFQSLRPIDQLLSTVQTTFPPAFGIEPHPYFSKWKPFSPGAFSSSESAVLKKAMRKMKFFLHPDKQPRDLSTNQAFLFKMLWDITSDSWEATAEKT